jgi:hypothetical protein
MAGMAAMNKESGQECSAQIDAAVKLVRVAKQQGLALPEPDSLLKKCTKTVLESALDEEESSI